MYSVIKYFHSGWRYVVMLLIVLAIIRAFADWFGHKSYGEGNRKFNLFAMISAHIQLLLGLVLYFLSPLPQPGHMGEAMKNAVSRYWTVEHLTMMVIAVVLITIGHSRSKKATEAVAKNKAIAIFYTLAIIVVLIALNNPEKGVRIFGNSF
ncbi:hypothetical protein SAMN05216436_101280 [bacterium A37T11]|nr:hypothetical protein SAMN05216436_101280 [bacterium A37T11]